MARWSKGDYSHLYGRDPDFILEYAIKNRTYGKDLRSYVVTANERLLVLYGERSILTLDDLHAEVERVREPKHWSTQFALDYIGNLIGWGLHGEILERVDEPGAKTGFRLLHREPAWVLEKGRPLKILGLPDGEQIAMNIRMSRLRRLRQTLSRKRDEATAVTVAAYLDRIVAARPDAPINAVLLGYIEEGFRELAAASTVRQARELLLDVHVGWELPRQRHWLRSLEVIAEREEVLAGERARERAAEAARMLAEDAEAFADL